MQCQCVQCQCVQCQCVQCQCVQRQCVQCQCVQCQNCPTAHAAVCSVPDARPSRSTTFSCRPRHFSLPQTVLTGPTKPPVSGCRVFCPRVKRAGRKADHSKSSFAVESEWSRTSTPPVCLYTVNRDSFTFTFTTYTAINALVRFQIVVVKVG
jgi:hypothetical protein